MEKIRMVDMPELPEVPMIDEKDLGDRLVTVSTRLGERFGKRIGSGIGGCVTWGLGTINDILSLPHELSKK